MNFFNGLLVGAAGAFLILGICQWCSRCPQPGRRVLQTTGGVATKAHQNVLTGDGLICLSTQTVITLFVGTIYSQAALHRDGLELILGWFASTLMLGVVFAFLGTRPETTISTDDEPEGA
jgi:hypothetical protein